jgi:Holliday junction DNA helicase RuvA
MIAFLQGTPQILEDSVIVHVNGVGYKVEVGQRTLTSLNKNEVKLFIHTYVREDRMELFGFTQTQQLKLFQLMIDISGVGPKTALEIVDRNPEQIIEAVQNAQVNFFKSIPRIGKKTAQKIILELKPKLGSLKELSLGPRSALEQDVYEALSALGYEETDISQALSDLDLGKLTVEDAVKKVLQNL